MHPDLDNINHQCQRILKGLEYIQREHPDAPAEVLKWMDAMRDISGTIKERAENLYRQLKASFDKKEQQLIDKETEYNKLYERIDEALAGDADLLTHDGYILYRTEGLHHAELMTVLDDALRQGRTLDLIEFIKSYQSDLTR